MRCACVFDVVRQRLRRPLLPPQLPPPNHSSRPIGHSRTVHCGRRMLTPPPLSNWPTSRSLWPHLNETCRVSRLYRRRFLRSNLKSGLKKLDFLKYFIKILNSLTLRHVKPYQNYVSLNFTLLFQFTHTFVISLQKICIKILHIKSEINLQTMCSN